MATEGDRKGNSPFTDELLRRWQRGDFNPRDPRFRRPDPKQSKKARQLAADLEGRRLDDPVRVQFPSERDAGIREAARGGRPSGRKTWDAMADERKDYALMQAMEELQQAGFEVTPPNGRRSKLATSRGRQRQPRRSRLWARSNTSCPHSASLNLASLLLAALLLVFVLGALAWTWLNVGAWAVVLLVVFAVALAMKPKRRRSSRRW